MVLRQRPSTFTHLGGHVAISASLPSGRRPVVEIREKLATLMSESGTLPLIDFVCGCRPTVRHLNEGAYRFRADAIYVGTVHEIKDVSPWSMPLPSADFEANSEFLLARADLHGLLWHLQDKVLICDCGPQRSTCWASLLVHTYCSIFDVVFEDSDADNIEGNHSHGSMDVEDDDPKADKESSQLARHHDLSAGGRQGSRRRPAQLIRDGLKPGEHLQEALALSHPYVSNPVSTEPVNLALSPPRPHAHCLVAWRSKVTVLLEDLAAAVAEDDEDIMNEVNPMVKSVLQAYTVKKLAFMRELSYITAPKDFAAIACLAVGLPMLGWTFPVFGMLERSSPPANSYADWKSDCAARNSKVLARIHESGDSELDSRAFDKTMEEARSGVLVGPFYDISEIPSVCPGIAPRCGIWECHGEAEESDVRNIDDLLSGGQNGTAGSTHSHRPTDVDALVAQGRAVASACPGVPLAGWSSDFSKAYKQVPGDPTQVHDLVLAQYDPVNKCAAFFVPLSLVFGSKTAPVNFARFPAFFCEVVARIFRLPATHCVDDVIFIEELEAANSGKECWDSLMLLSGWRMNASKGGWPAQLFSVIGVSVDLRPLPRGIPSIMVTQRRIGSLKILIKFILAKAVLGSGEAASLAGKLGFTLSATFGRVGRCRLRPIMRRSYSVAKKLNEELMVCLVWWLRFLAEYCPRPIPTTLCSLPCVVSYSDGEGGLAGIGAAVWHPHKPRPLAVYTEVPQVVRDQWRKIQGLDGYEDIFLVEALGPLLLLSAFPNVLKNCLWLHFIDNSAAEASLIRGASSSQLGDHIVGLTWSLIQRRLLWAYFDRVESKANPVDGLSRRCFAGPWEWVKQHPFPLDDLASFAAAFADGTYGA